MIYVICSLVCFAASLIGSICGVGGGVIIKPVLDAAAVMDVSTISFLSGCTVLSMTAYSVLRNKICGDFEASQATVLPLAIGAAAGGIIGNWLFSYVQELSPDKNKVGGVQAVCLLIVTLGALIYTINNKRIKTYRVNNKIVCICIGSVLGMLSSFLGIGGGPINLVVLYFFFSMNTKTAAGNSLYIIFFSQTASLISTIVTGSVPSFHISILVLMVICGITGAVCGRLLNSRIKENTVEKLFIGLIIIVIFINIYNIIKLI